MKTCAEQLAIARVWKANNRDRVNAYMAEYRRKHRTKLLKQVSQWMKRNRKRINAVKRARYLIVHGPPKPRIKRSGAEYYTDNREKILSRMKANRAARIDAVREQGRKYYHKHRHKRLLQAKLYKEKNQLKVQLSLRAWRSKNKVHVNNYMRNRLATNIHAAIRHRMSSRILKVLKRNKLRKNNTTVKFLGIGLDGFKKHIESLFLPGMSWSNRHLWHIDHVRPCSSFDLTIPEQQFQCFNYKNLQPLWALDNMRKSDKFIA